MHKIKLCSGIIFMVMVFLSVTVHVSASEFSEALYSFSENGEVSLFVKLQYSDMKPEKCFIDNEESEIVRFGAVEDTKAAETVFLFDEAMLTENSDAQEKAVEMSKALLMNAHKNEQFCISLYGDGSLSVIEDFTDNQLAALEAVSGIEFGSSDADIFDGIRRMTAKLNDESNTVFKRIIVFTDSASVNSSEISESITGMKYPVYFILMDKENVPLYDDKLLSDTVFSEYYRCSGTEDAELISEKLNDFTKIHYCQAKVPEEMLSVRDDREIRIDFAGNDCFVSVTSYAEIKPYSDSTPVIEQKKGMTVIIAAFLVIIILLSACIIVILRKLRKEEKPVENKTPQKTAVLPCETETLQTTILNDKTRILLDDMYLCRIILTERNNDENVVEISGENEAVIGRNRALADYAIMHEKSISQKHCKIFVRNKRVYVTDLESSNHTYVDEIMVDDETELITGSVLRLGRLSFNVEIIPM